MFLHSLAGLLRRRYVNLNDHENVIGDLFTQVDSGLEKPILSDINNLNSLFFKDLHSNCHYVLSRYE